MRYRVVSNVLLERNHGLESEQEVTQIMAAEIERSHKTVSGAVGLEL